MSGLCFLMKIDKSCCVVGTITFVLSFVSIMASTTLLLLHDHWSLEIEVLLNLGKSSSIIFLTVFLIVNIIWFLASIMLLIGVKQRKSGCVLFNFAFGIMVTILLQLGGLLQLLGNRWILSIIVFLASLLHIHFLMVVYKFYELILNIPYQQFDEQPILEEEQDDD